MNIFNTCPKGKFAIVNLRGELLFKLAPAGVKEVGALVVAKGETPVAYLKDGDNWIADEWGLKHIVELLEAQLDGVDYCRVVIDPESLNVIKKVYGTACFSDLASRPTVEFVSSV